MTKGKDKVMLLELAERCEKAPGPDRVLNAEIHCALNPEFHVDQRDNGVIFVVKDKDKHSGFYTGAAEYTASLDAAMTLVPEGLEFRLSNSSARLYERRRIDKGITLTELGHGNATLPALALCAAALRAKAAAQ